MGKKMDKFKRTIVIFMASLVGSSLLTGVTKPAIAAEQNNETPQEIVSKMTLEQKIGQMIMPAFRKWTDETGEVTNVRKMNDSIREAIQKYGFGGIALFGENTSGTQQTAELVYDMQEAVMSEESKTQIPLIISIDQEGGNVVRLGTGTSLCGNMALGATGDKELVYSASSLIGSELSALGINTDFAPDMDVNNNPSNPVIGIRSFSNNPLTVAAYGSAYITGLHSKNIATAIKHFPGHGDTATDSHTGLPCINKTYEELQNFELVPFKYGINNNTDMVMTAHIQFPNIEKETYISKKSGETICIPATLSKTIITDILRNDLKFDGVVSTDAMEMGAIKENFGSKDAAKLAINADVDILLMPVDMSTQEGIDSMEEYINNIVDMVNEGQISEDTITKSAERIIKLKQDRGILSKQTKTKEQIVQEAKTIVGSKANHDLEWTITQKAITMLKNDKDTLPIKLVNGQKLLIFCPYENEINSVQYAINRMREKGIIPKGANVTICSYQNKMVDDFISEINEAACVLSTVETYKVANMNPKEEAGWESEFLDKLISTVHVKGKKIAVISTQLPYDVARYQNADALLLAYGSKAMPEISTEYNGEVCTYGPNIPVGICVAFGEVVPSGKLPVDIMKLNENYQYTDEILYPAGSGITSWGKKIDPQKDDPKKPVKKDDNKSNGKDIPTGDSTNMAIWMCLLGVAVIVVAKNREMLIYKK